MIRFLTAAIIGFFLTSASVILLRNVGEEPEIMVIHGRTTLQFPIFVGPDDAPLPPVESLRSSYNFDFAGKTTVIEEVSFGAFNIFQYSVVYCPDLSVNDPSPAKASIEWVSLKSFYEKRVRSRRDPRKHVHDNIKRAASSPAVAEKIQKVLPNPLILLRIGAYGEEQVLTQAPDPILPIYSEQFIQNFEIDFCDVVLFASPYTVCRLKHGRYDGGLNSKLTVNGISMTWRAAKSIPELDSMAPEDYEKFLKDFKIIVPKCNLSNVAILKSTQKFYINEANSWLHPITDRAREETVKMTFDPTRQPSRKTRTTVYSLEPLDTFAAAVKLLEANGDEKIMLVSFANNLKAGGGYKIGSKAQEDDLFRASDLSFSLGQLANSPAHYPINRIVTRNDNGLVRHLFSTNALYTPEVHILRERENWRFFSEEQIRRYKVSVCSIAAFNFKDPSDKPAFGLDTNGQKLFTKGGLDATLNRLRMMFQMADMKGVDTLIVGAFGCGAFANPQDSIIWLFNKVIHEYHGSIKHIQFAIIGQENIDAFDEGIIAFRSI